MLQSYFGDTIEAGCDEAGRGPLAGPVVAAAVILPKDFFHPLLNDSKKLSSKQRALLEPLIRSEALYVGLGEASVEEIDRVNILQATFLAMHRAIDDLIKKGGRPELLLIDGNRFKPYLTLSHKCVIGGDAILASIAAASILAKNRRDRRMHLLASHYPGYGWETNKGYPTRMHREAILMKGFTPHHRRTFVIKPFSK